MTVISRFWAKVDKTEDCWLWTGHLTDGYGRHWISKGHQEGAHRFAYELLVGPIPAGLQIDHLCRIRNCVNPDHLEPVTQRENLLRGDTFQAANAAKTHCPQGHLYDASCNGRRTCLTCGRERTARYRARQETSRREGVGVNRRRQ